MPTCKLVEDGEQFRPEITEEPGGFRGVRHGWVDTGDITAALLSAAGAPRRGDSWDTLAPNLIVQRRTATLWSGNLCLMRFEYATPGLGGGVLEYPAAIGKPISVAAPSVSSVTAKKFIDASPGQAPIAQGQGVPREVGLMDERVKVAYAMSNLSAVPWSRIRRLHTTNAVNKDNVVLPNYFGSGYAKAAEASTLRYRLVEFELQADLFVVTHVMASADVLGHWVTYQELDQDGNPVADVSGPIYPEENFAGLW